MSGVDDPTTPVGAAEDPTGQPPLFLVKGGATAEEVAALTVVLRSLAVGAADEGASEPASEWAAHHRKVRAVYPAGPGGWRSSALPR